VVEVAHEQVGAAGVAQFADLGEQPGDGDVGFGGEPAAQVLAVGVDQGAAIPRGLICPAFFGPCEFG